jgi:hypothetical protein
MAGELDAGRWSIGRPDHRRHVRIFDGNGQRGVFGG